MSPERTGETVPIPLTGVIGDRDSAEPTALSFPIPPEAIEILGVETCQRLNYRLERLASFRDLAETPDPFDKQGPSADIDLDFIEPEIAEKLKGDKPFKLKNEYMDEKIASGGRLFIKSANKLLKVGKKLRKQIIKKHFFADAKLRSIDDDIQEFETYDGSTPLDIDRASGFMESIEGVSQDVSLQSTQTLQNLFTAFVDIGVRTQQKGGLFFNTESIIRRGIERATYVKIYHEQAQFLSKNGSTTYENLMELIRVGQIYEFDALFSVLEAAKESIKADEVEPARQSAVLETERFLTSIVNFIESCIEETYPDILEDDKLKPFLNKLGRPDVALTLQARRMVESQVKVEEAIDLPLSLSSAKDVVRGGRRLKPTGEQTEAEIKSKADSLHKLTEKDNQDEKLLYPEETGVIMSVVTGKFEDFVRTIEGIKDIDLNTVSAALPPEKLKTVRELQGFDLTNAIERIKTILEDKDDKLRISQIIGNEEVVKVTIALDKLDI